MIVIQGKNEKSLELQRLIEENIEPNKVLIIDSVGVNTWNSSERVEVWSINEITDYREFISGFIKNYAIVSEFNTIAFYVNADIEIIKYFQEIDHKYPHRFIITIQTDEEVHVYLD